MRCGGELIKVAMVTNRLIYAVCRFRTAGKSVKFSPTVMSPICFFPTSFFEVPNLVSRPSHPGFFLGASEAK